VAKKKSANEKRGTRKTPQKRRPKERSYPRSHEGIRALADELRDVVRRLDRYADSMQTLGIASIRPLTGNFHQALERIRLFTTQQVLGRLIVEASKLGIDAHELLAP
jgi:hypothetical protein